MGVSGVGGSNDMMMSLMNTLMKGMEANAEMSQKMIAMTVENSSVATKMATAQNIIDVYA